MKRFWHKAATILAIRRHTAIFHVKQAVNFDEGFMRNTWYPSVHIEGRHIVCNWCNFIQGNYHPDRQENVNRDGSELVINSRHGA